MNLKIVLHALGLSYISGAVLLQMYIFTNILLYGSFVAVEHYNIILYSEIGLSIAGIAYTMFLFISFLYHPNDFIKSFISKENDKGKP